MLREISSLTRIAWPIPRAPSLTFGAWFQRLRSNELLALSQYGQATFTSVQTLLQGVAATLLYDPAPTPLGWRSWFGAFYAEDVIRLRPSLTVSLGVPRRVHHRLERARRPRVHLHLPERHNLQPTRHWNLRVHGEQREVPAAAAHWLRLEPRGENHRTAVRAGFGMFNDLQDALGYRTDQNAPFNPTYSVPNLPVGPVPAVTTASALHRETRSRRSAARSPHPTWSLGPCAWSRTDANTMLQAGYVGSHGYHEILGLDANDPSRLSVQPPLPCHLSRELPGGSSRARPFRRDLTMFLARFAPMPRSRTRGLTFRKQTVRTKPTD